MERKLPTYDIEGTTFIVEVEHFSMRQKDRPSNKIPLDQLVNHGLDFYAMLYNTRTKNMAGPYDGLYDNVVKVKIPQMVRLDPEGMAKKYGMDQKELAGKNDMEVIFTDNKNLIDRIEGKMPTLEIDGKDFSIDVSSGVLTRSDDLTIKIDLGPLSPRDNSPYCTMFYYDLKMRQPSKLPIDKTPLQFGENIVILKIPHPMELDPVGAARALGKHDTFFQKDIPAFPYHKAQLLTINTMRIDLGQGFPSTKEKPQEGNRKKKANHL